MTHIHTIPVPRGWTPDQAWHDICVMGFLSAPDDHCTWANVACDGEECASIRQADDAA